MGRLCRAHPFFFSVTSLPFGHLLSRLAFVSTKGPSPLSSAALLGWRPMLHNGVNVEDQITLSSHPTRAHGLGVAICNGLGGGFWRTTFEIFGMGSRAPILESRRLLFSSSHSASSQC